MVLVGPNRTYLTLFAPSQQNIDRWPPWLTVWWRWWWCLWWRTRKWVFGKTVWWCFTFKIKEISPKDLLTYLFLHFGNFLRDKGVDGFFFNYEKQDHRHFTVVSRDIWGRREKETMNLFPSAHSSRMFSNERFLVSKSTTQTKGVGV